MPNNKVAVVRCACGRRMNKYANVCSTCHNARMAELHAKNSAIVATGKCPDCGAGLRRNLSMTGWWQCEQLGAETFRKDPTKPPCSFQCFTA